MIDWDGNTSLVDYLGARGIVRLQGIGLLTAPPNEDGTSSYSGKVRFVVGYELGRVDHPYNESIRVTLVGLDEDANEMLQRGLPPIPGVPLPRHSLEGTLTEPSEGVHIRLESVFLDPASLSIQRSKEDMDALFAQVEALERYLSSGGDGGDEDFDVQEWGTAFKEWVESPGLAREREAWAWRVVVGDDTEAAEPSRCRLLVPNLPTHASVDSGRLRIDVQPVPGAQGRLTDPEAQGKMLPGSFVEIRPTSRGSGDEVVLATAELGWLLSFWAGRAVHPIAWETETSRGPVRYIEVKTVAPLKHRNPNTCLLAPTLEDLGSFLESAWIAWRDLSATNEAWLRTLKSVISFYQETLSATFANVRLALTAMALERLREQVLGDSELLRDLSTSKRNNIEREIRRCVREVIRGMDRLSDAEDVRQQLLDSLAANPSKVKEIFRKPFWASPGKTDTLEWGR